MESDEWRMAKFYRRACRERGRSELQVVQVHHIQHVLHVKIEVQREGNGTDVIDLRPFDF
jgi:hypothetical protein